MKELLQSQYELVKGSRSALFTYCSTTGDDFFKSVPTFNDNSIRGLLVHIANTYISWLDNFGLDGSRAFYGNEEVQTLYQIKAIFDEVDLIVNDFFEKYQNDYQSAMTKHIARKGITLTLSPLQLFTHVITHEFHHKGQILTMSRLLGYTPVDTDIIRF
ncbi:MAG TPA: DinB family protein [Mucilaginibacter sp.]